MANLSTKGPSIRARGVRFLVLSLILVFAFVTAAVAQDVYVPPGSIDPDSWSTKGGWVSGLNASLMEGQTAPNAVRIVDEEGMTYKLSLCIQVFEDPFTNAYGFTAFEPWDKSFMPGPGIPAIDPIPVMFDQGAPIDYPDYLLPAWDRDHPFVWGYNIEILSVSDPPAMGYDQCDDNELGVTVDFTVNSATDAYIVFGSHIARAGDPIPGGGVVGASESASFMTGNFQTRMATPAGDKTLPFKVEYNPNAVSLNSFGATASQGLPYGLALLGLAVAGATGFVIRKRK